MNTRITARNGLDRWCARLAFPTLALVAAGTAAPAIAAVELQEIFIHAGTRIQSTDLGIKIDLDDQASQAPFAVFRTPSGEIANGIAEAYIDLPEVVDGRQTYAAATQKSIANAVAAQTTYSTAEGVQSTGETTWKVGVRNTGTTAEPVVFSFYLAGGEMDAWCAACGFGAITTQAEAKISVEVEDNPVLTRWDSKTFLVARSSSTALLDGDSAGSIDMLGIGYPTAAIVHHPDPFDPFTQAAISPFNASATLFALEPGQMAWIEYSLTVSSYGPGTAFGSAWLVDPFRLGLPGNPERHSISIQILLH